MAEILLQIRDITKSYGDRMLFQDVAFTLERGDKIGIVARNGAGKSTLLDIIAGKTDYDSGQIIVSNGISVGYLSQEPDFKAELPLLAQVYDGINLVGVDADEMRRRAESLLSQFGLDEQTWSRNAEGMSGGQLKRAAIARMLLAQPDLMMLDEPTNHLDIEMIEWLENHLSQNRASLLLVSHDRYFLDQVCNRILEVDNTLAYLHPGGFDKYLERKAERQEAQTAELAKVKNLLRTELEWMRRQPQARGSKAKYRIDNFYDLEKRSHVAREQGNVRLDVNSTYIGSKIFEAEHVSKAFGDKVILNDWSYNFARYEKVGIVGDNGTGKSTFIKLLLGMLKPDSGKIDIGQTVRWGYYSQEGMTDFDENKMVIDAVREIAEDVRINDNTRLTASQFLTRFLFSVKDQRKYIYRLSGGERRRLYLATVLMQSPNFLVLDEPTNDLDIVTLSVLEEYLREFKGCVIVVSHDRFFLDRIVDHLFVFKGDGKILDFPGDYSTYRHCVRRERAEMAKAKKPQQESKSEATRREHNENRPRRLSFKEQREKQELEERLPRLEKEKKELEESLAYGDLGHEELATLGNRFQELCNEIDDAEMRLLELMDI